MKNLGYLFVAVAMFGCGADATTPTASGVFPSSAFLGRDVRVEVSGDATNWKDGATVSFGDGVTVKSVEVASPTDLFADITVTDQAALGLKDVVVTDSNKSFTLTQAFEVKSPMQLDLQGTVAQGSVVVFNIINKDSENPFDTTQAGDGFFTPITFPNIDIEGSAGVHFQVNTVSDLRITGLILTDIDAAPGAVTLTSGPAGGNTVSFPLGDNLTVMARSATLLTEGTPASGMVTNPFDSALFEFDPTAPAFATISSDTSNTSASPGVIILPGGHWADFEGDFAVSVEKLVASGKLYAIYWDGSGVNGYSFTVGATQIPLTSVNETEPNDNGTTQVNTISTAAFVNGASLSADTDVDFYKFTVTAAAVGKQVHVKTAGDLLTDTIIEVCTTAACGAATSLGTSGDNDFQEEMFSNPIPSGTTTIFVKVTAGSAFDPGHGGYVAGVALE